MALKFGTALRNARANVVESTVGTTPVLRAYTGSAPADADAAATGTLIVEIDLPSDWAGAASDGEVDFINMPVSGDAGNAGTLGYFRIWDSGVSVSHIQGTISESGGGGDLIADNTDVEAGQTVTLTGYTITEGNA